MTWKVGYYQTERGDSPIVDFLDSLSEKARAKCLSYIDLLEERGSSLTRNYVSKIADDIWELRPEFGGTEYRFSTLCSSRIILSFSVPLQRKRSSLNRATSRLHNPVPPKFSGVKPSGNRHFRKP